MKLNKSKLKLNPKQALSTAKRRLPGRSVDEKSVDALPRITNDTVAAHREEVLSSARKYIYPLQHSKHRVVTLTVSIVVVAVVVFFAWCTLALYKFHSTSAFLYDVTRVVPFPVAKVGSDYVGYENYLFELRHYMHYYQTQQKVDFNTDKHQLQQLKQQALQQVIDDAYIKHLAAQNHVAVSGKEVDDEVKLVQSQNRLGGNQRVFEDVLKEYWGWSLADFKRELQQELLAQKVVATLDTGAQRRAQQALNQLKNGAKFETVAKAYSDDTNVTLAGGQYLTTSSPDISPQVAAALAPLQPGQYSGVVNDAFSLEILKVTARQGDKFKAEHIQINLKDVSTYLGPLESKQPPHKYISV